MSRSLCVFSCADANSTDIYTLSLHDALPIYEQMRVERRRGSSTAIESQATGTLTPWRECPGRSEEHTSELQSLRHLVCRLLLEKKKKVYVNVDEGEANLIGVFVTLMSQNQTY